MRTDDAELSQMVEGAAATLASRLRARREEIDSAMLARLTSVSPLPARADYGYAEGLRAAVAAAVEHVIAALEGEGSAADPIPPAMLAQARLAARSGVGLDAVARRHVAGYGLISQFVLQEAGGSLSPAESTGVLRELSLAVDRLLSGSSAAYLAEADARRQGRDQARLRQIERLLAGDLLDADSLGYDLGLSHLGILATGTRARRTLRSLADEVGARLLAASPTETLHWAWLGSRSALDPEKVLNVAGRLRPAGAALALGEPAVGAAGWRLTHRQGQAALAIALRRGKGVVRYCDVALLAAIVQDDLLATSLRRLYLEPLEGGRNGGAVLRETLRAYFAAGRNGASAAGALGVSRQTVNDRLRTAEERLGRPLLTAGLELDAALRLAELTGPPPAPAPDECPGRRS